MTNLPTADWSSHPIEGFARAAVERGWGYNGSYFSCPLISEIVPNLWMGGCIQGLTLPDEIKYVVSLYDREAYKLNPGVERKEIVMYDAGFMPDVKQLHQIADEVNVLRGAGPTLVHCQAGLNRSGLVTALALIKDGRTPREAIDLLREKRSPLVLCNETFENWLLSL